MKLYEGEVIGIAAIDSNLHNGKFNDSNTINRIILNRMTHWEIISLTDSIITVQSIYPPPYGASRIRYKFKPDDISFVTFRYFDNSFNEALGYGFPFLVYGTIEFLKANNIWGVSLIVSAYLYGFFIKEPHTAKKYYIVKLVNDR